MKRFLISLLFLSTLVAGVVRAQSPITLEQLKVSLWPEYDRPGVLVIYRAVLPASQTLPVELTFRIPSAAGEPNAVAYRADNLDLITMPYTRQVVGDLAMITFNATVREVQFEYYDPALEIQESQRRFSFDWPGDYAVSEFVVEVQQPAQATRMSMTPALGSGTLGNDGMTYFTAVLGSVPSGQTQLVQLNYEKTGSGLSFERLQPVEPIVSPASLSDRLLSWPYWVWVLGALGVALLTLAVVLFVRNGRSRSDERPGRPRHRAASPGTTPLYCHNCGARADAQAVFCSTCGTKLRRGTDALGDS